MSERPELVREVGRWNLTALAINTSVGSAIFGLPVVIARLVGGASPIAYVIAGVFMAVIALCLAEVASRFREAGGPYLYARVAFGRFAGLQVGWALWLVRIAAGAANANLLTVYLGEFWKATTAPAIRVALITAIIGLLATINYCGVRYGARMSAILAITKLLPLTLFCVVGLFFLNPAHFRMGDAAGTADWTQAILLMVFAYGGFEAATIPAAEFRDPGRDAPFALGIALAVSVLLHVMVQVVVVGVLPVESMTERPLATAASVFFGNPGGLLMAGGAVLSIYGLLSASFLNLPRLTYALAERGDFPAFFAKVHPRFRTPYVSILLYSVLTWAFAVWGNFAWNASLSAVARLLVYISICLALLVLRHRSTQAPAFRLPGALVFSATGTVFCLFLMFRMGRTEFVILATTALLASATWYGTRSRALTDASDR